MDLVWQLCRRPVTSRDSFYVIVAACAAAQLSASTTVGTVEIPRLESYRSQLGELASRKPEDYLLCLSRISSTSLGCRETSAVQSPNPPCPLTALTHSDRNSRLVCCCWSS